MTPPSRSDNCPTQSVALGQSCHCHCEERSDVAIRSLSDPSGAGRCFAPQGMRIATPLRARNDDESRQLIPLIGLGTHRTRSAGWCSAQRIQNPMIAGGNHTLIPMTPPYRAFPSAGHKKRSCTAAPPLRTIFRSPTQYDRFVRGDSPQEMTLGDSVNNRQGSFPFSFGI